jgi:hypothetical protein
MPHRRSAAIFLSVLVIAIDQESGSVNLILENPSF